MANRQKSLFRGPGVKHYALVHRSVRDPALNEDGATERVLAELPKKQGRTKQELEGLLEKTGGLGDLRENEGEAAAHGIFYDDSKYDYMQHLKIVGQNVDAQLVEAPRRNDTKGKGKALSLALKEEEEHRARIDQEGSYKTYLEGTAPVEGLQPDMDPALREVLEALEDDAYIADGTEDQASSETGDGEDFFSNLIAGSGKGDFRETPFDAEDDDFFDEEEEEEDDDGMDGVDPSSAYDQEVLRFKKPKGTAADSDDDLSDEEYEASEGGDTIAALQAASARRAPRKAGLSDRKSTASASAFSMSSSAMFRNEGLQTLDDRFDQIESMYDEEESDDDDEPRELAIGQKQQFDHALEEFLTKYEVVSGKMRQTLGDSSTTPAQKLGAIREQFEKMNVLEHVKRQQREERLVAIARKKADRTLDDELWDMVRDIDAKEDKWDCESILSTYSNIENHPRMLKLRGAVASKAGRDASAKREQQAKITIDPKTGFPVVIEPASPSLADAESDAESDSTMDAEEMNSGKRQTIARPKGETPEQKKARKEQAKAEKQGRRQEKKATKEAFGTERKKQMKVKKNQTLNAADVARGNTRNISVMSLS